jgi:hypothetical protein
LRLPFLRIRLHHIFISDNYYLHDHPWHFLSIILKGGYFEITESEEKVWYKNLWGNFYLPKTVMVKEWKKPGSFLFRSATHRHRVELPPGKTSWSLLFMIPVKRDWGFWKGGNFFHHEEMQNCNE